MTKPTDQEVYEFDAAAVQAAVDAAREGVPTGASAADVSTMDISTAAGAELTVLAQCISVTVRNRKVCLGLPLGLGQVCLPIPINVGDGTSAQACLDIRTTWGIPTGVCVSISVGGTQIVRKCFP